MAGPGHTIRVDKEVYDLVLRAKQKVERDTGRVASMSDGVQYLIDLLDADDEDPNQTGATP